MASVNTSRLSIKSQDNQSSSKIESASECARAPAAARATAASCGPLPIQSIWKSNSAVESRPIDDGNGDVATGDAGKQRRKIGHRVGATAEVDLPGDPGTGPHDVSPGVVAR